MSKIKVNTLESDENVKLSPTGSGVVEVKGAGNTDGTLGLTSGSDTQVKIKSPAHSAQQSYTLVMPDNALSTSDFLKVKSVTGSGNTTTSQLEYASVAVPDVNNLNASNISSNTVPTARFPTTFPSSSAALKLESKLTVPSGTNPYTISQTITEGFYWIIVKSLVTDISGYGGWYIEFRDNQNNSWYNRYVRYYSGISYNNYDQNQSRSMNTTYNTLYGPYNYATVIHLSNRSRPWAHVHGFVPGRTLGRFENYMYATNTNPATSIIFDASGWNHTFREGTQILFYKYQGIPN